MLECGKKVLSRERGRQKENKAMGPCNQVQLRYYQRPKKTRTQETPALEAGAPTLSPEAEKSLRKRIALLESRLDRLESLVAGLTTPAP